MAKGKPSEQQLAQIREFAAQWGKIVARRISPESGPLDFAAMEQIAAAAAAGLTEGTLGVLLDQQAQALGTEPPCPECGRACPVKYEDRPLTVKGGTQVPLHEPICHCPDCRRDFFPPRPCLGLDSHNYGPTVLLLISKAAARLPSAEAAAFALTLAEIRISSRHVQRIAGEVGDELIRQRDHKVAQRRRRELPVRVAATPEVVAAEADGGRLRTREAGRGPGVHDEQNKEDKVGRLVSLQSQVHEDDPQPEPPQSLLEPRRVQRLVRQMKGQAADAPQEETPPEDLCAAEQPPAERPGGPGAVGEDDEARWRAYVAWLRACRQGRVAEVIEQLRCWQERLNERLGEPPEGEALEGKDPRRLVAEALSYLQNNQSRMDYPRYRREGLPITSSLAESLVGEFNARVKSRQKYWNRPEGAEAILQLRAAVLSEDDRLERYFAQRPGNPYRRRRTA